MQFQLPGIYILFYNVFFIKNINMCSVLYFLLILLIKQLKGMILSFLYTYTKLYGHIL